MCSLEHVAIPMRGTALHDRFVLAVAALFLCAHLAWPLGQLEDIDSFNFALGMRDYDVAAHQPHPPGYPVFTALARGSAHLVGLFDAGASGSPADFGRRSAIAMALRLCDENLGPLPMILWQYGFVSLGQLNQIFDWLER